MSLLDTDGLIIGHNGKPLSDEINFSLQHGDVVCLMGINGSGKSTLLKTLFGITLPLAGEILIDGISLTKFSSLDLAKKMAIVLTEKTELPHMTVEEVIAIGRFPHTNLWGTIRKHDQQVIDKVIELTGLIGLKKFPFDHLSDGQKQIVMIARSLAQSPKILLLDEPTTFLDIPHKLELIKLLSEIAVNEQMAILFSSHDGELVIKNCSKLWLLDKQFYQGTPAELIASGNIKKVFPSFCEETKSFF